MGRMIWLPVTLLFLVVSSTLCRAAGEGNTGRDGQVRAAPVERDFLSTFGATSNAFGEAESEADRSDYFDPGISSNGGHHQASVDYGVPNSYHMDGMLPPPVHLHEGYPRQQFVTQSQAPAAREEHHHLGGQGETPLSWSDDHHTTAFPDETNIAAPVPLPRYRLADHGQNGAAAQTPFHRARRPRQGGAVRPEPGEIAARQSRARRAYATWPASTIVMRGDFDDHYWHRGPSRPGQDNSVLRRQAGYLCRRKGLWVGMDAKELAAGLAEVKVELGTESSMRVGTMTSKYIRRCAGLTEAYLTELQHWGGKFTRSIARIESNPDLTNMALTHDEHVVAVLSSLRFLRDRHTFLNNVRQARTETDFENTLDEEARTVWNALERSDELAAARQHLHAALMPAQYLPMEVIELASRGLGHLCPPDISSEEAVNLLRRFLLKTLHRTTEELDVFNKARNDWLKTQHEALNQINR